MAETYEEAEEKILKSGRSSKAFGRLIRMIIGQKRETLLLVTAVVISAISGTVYPLALGYAINGVVQRNAILLALYALLFILSYLIRFFFNRLRTITSTKLAQITVKKLRDDAFSTLQYTPMSFFSKVKTGYLISRISNDAENLSDFLTFQLPQVIGGITTVIISIAIMSYLDFSLTLYALIIIPVMVTFTISLQGKIRKNYLRTRKTIAAITGNLAENISSIRTIKSFGVEDRTYDDFDKLNRKNFSANIKASFLSSIYGSAVNIMEAAGIAIVIVAGSMQLMSGLITVGLLVSFIVYVQEFFDPVLQLSQLYNSYQASVVGLVRIFGIIDSPTEASFSGLKVNPEIFEKLEFRNVYFSYGKEDVLKDINLTIRKGDKLAIVGHTGAGKTTLLNLFLRFYSPTGGTIMLNGTNIEKVSIKSWRSLISPVLQDPFLFDGTVLENIRFSRPDVDLDLINKLAREYGLDEIFDSLPNGLATRVGEMGRNLSEGQRQAISVMRAFIRESPFIVLDEPTSQIDPESETVIIRSLKKYLENRTLVLITHRFSMLPLADRIVVINNGMVEGAGGFHDLMERSPTFSELYSIHNAGRR